MITLIAAIGQNNELGLDNKLLWNIPEDMRHFKSYTMGKVILMGRKTYDSIGRKPLPGRRCIVVSKSKLNGIVIPAYTIEDALSVEYCYDELVVIGGASIYSQTIDLADKLVITHIEESFEADTFFPTIDSRKWKINNVLNGNTEPCNYRFVEYIRNETK